MGKKQDDSNGLLINDGNKELAQEEKRKMLPFNIPRERGTLSCLKKIATAPLGFSNNVLKQLFKSSQFLFVRPS